MIPLGISIIAIVCRPLFCLENDPHHHYLTKDHGDDNHHNHDKVITSPLLDKGAFVKERPIIIVGIQWLLY